MEEQKGKKWYDSELAKQTLIDNGERATFVDYLHNRTVLTMKRSMADLHSLA
jgi:hypothetical protein